MKHRHIFVPPFWKHNRFCLFCGRLESLTVGKNTVQLTDDKISFGTATTLNAAKQLGFDASSRLVYHDGASVKSVANINEIGGGGGDIVKIVSIATIQTTIQGTTVETTIFDIPFTPNFTTYPNGYLVVITPISSELLITVTNDNNNDGLGVAGVLTLNHYLTDTIFGGLLFHFNTTAMRFVNITDYMIYLVKSSTVDYRIVYWCFGKHTNLANSYIVYNSSTFGYALGSGTVSTFNVPTRIKLSAIWDVANNDLYASFSAWFVILYGLR